MTNRILETESMLAINQTNDQIATQIKELSEREMMVLRLINKSYNEIADEMYIARETVISHKKNIESKLGISGKENLVEYAIKIGVIEGK